MVEIVILIVLAGKIGKIVEKKGRKKIGYQLMLVGMWIGGEVFGIVLGTILGMLMGIENPTLLAVGCGLTSAIVAAVIAFAIAKALDPVVVEEPAYQNLEYVDRLGAREHFGDRRPSPPVTDGYKDSGEKAQRPPDEHIQG